MSEKESKYIIIGAGLSGLTTAYHLLQNGEKDFVILEGREEVGGRIHRHEDVDLGAVWFNDTHTHLTQFVKELSLKTFEQYSEGESLLIYSSMAPAHQFVNQGGEININRFVNGTLAIIKSLSDLVRDKIHTDTTVSSITEIEDILEVETNTRTFTAKRIISTLPPKLALKLSYSPELPHNVLEAMEKTHTWMSNAIKVGITFKTPFWKEKGLSGTVIGQIGPVIELYDHSNAEGTAFSLMGFVNEGLRDETAEYRKERILAYLEKHLGHEVRAYISYFEKDWSMDKYTSCTNLKSVYMSPEYGNPLFQESYLGNKLLFSGTETSKQFGGYLEGAIRSGENAARKSLK